MAQTHTQPRHLPRARAPHVDLDRGRGSVNRPRARRREPEWHPLRGNPRLQAQAEHGYLPRAPCGWGHDWARWPHHGWHRQRFAQARHDRAAPFFFFFRGPFSRQSRVPAVSAYLVLQSTEALLPGTLVRPLAAAHDRELPAHVCKHFVQLRRLSGDVALSHEREFQQGRGDGALGGDGVAARTSDARCPASSRSQVAASAPNRPPTSTPTTTKRQRRARTSSG